MSNRTTIKHLNGILARVRAVTGTQPFTWTRDGTSNRCTIGAYLIHQGSAINGIAWCLQLSMNDGGSVRDVVRGRTATDLFERIDSWLDGYRAGAETVKS